MPRGLGDNPLKKQRRQRHAASQASPATATPASPSETQTEPSQDNAQVSSSSSRSYNDVFFQRKPESSGAAANGVHEEVHMDEPVTGAPIAAAQPAPVPALPEVSASSVSEPAPTGVPVSSPGSQSSPTVESAPQPFVAPEQPKETPTERAAQPENQDETAPLQENKGGFLGRIFGRLRK